MGQECVVKLVIVSIGLIAFKFTRFNKIFEVKVFSVILSILISILLLLNISNNWKQESINLKVNMPSVYLMNEFVNELAYEFIEMEDLRNVPRNRKDAFYANMWNDLYIDDIEEKVKDEYEINNDNQEYEQIDDKENEKIHLIQYMKDEVIGYILNIIITLILMLIINIFYKLSFYPRYYNNLKSEINSSAHMWMGDNSLKDILIAVNIVSSRKLNVA